MATREQAPTFEIVVVTPDLAREWLACNSRNRNVRKVRVHSFAHDMTEGRWQMTAEPIKFGIDGTLLDGQHRLMAVEQANVPVSMVVARGLAAESQDVMDTGSKRQASDQLKISGYSNASQLAAAAKWAILFDRKQLHIDRVARIVTHSDIKGYISSRPMFVESVGYAARNLREVEMPPGVRACCFYLMARKDWDASCEFWARVADGVELSSGSPILALRRRFREIRNRRMNVEGEAWLSMAIRSWNAYRDGSSMASVPTFKAGASVRCPDPK